MMICGVQNISKMFGGNLIFEDLSMDMNDGERIGLVGRNGSGKTTILKLIAGVESADSGQVIFKRGTKIGYLAQIPVYPEEICAREVMMGAFREILKLQEQLAELEGAMSHEKSDVESQKLLERYGAIQERFVLLDGYEAEAKLEKIANGLGIYELLSSSFHSLSGGEKTKVCLGMTLLQDPDLLLLDEPTNHLDITAVEWLEHYLREYRGTIVLVSHDRYFLDELVTKIIDIEDGAASIYHSNYSGFTVEKEKRLLEEFQQFQEQQKRIKKMKEAIKRLREWANQANPPNAGLHKRARNMERALERMEKVKRPIMERKTMGLQFEESARSGKDVIILENIEKRFGEKSLFREVNMQIQFNERVAIVGDNGTGKSTLLKMIQGEVIPDSGKLFVGDSVKIGYLSQSLLTGDGRQTILEAFRDHVVMTEGEARNRLAQFMFYGAAVFRKVANLSGGERMRLRLAQLMHQEINLLILDEPTNHLDIDSREVLEEALENFQGTILAVSHDRYLLNKLFEKTYWIDAKKVYHFAGGYSWARMKLEEARAKSVVQDLPKPKVEKHEKKKEISYEKLEKEIDSIETEMKKLDSLMESEKQIESLSNLFEQKNKLESLLSVLYEQLDNII